MERIRSERSSSVCPFPPYAIFHPGAARTQPWAANKVLNLPVRRAGSPDSDMVGRGGGEGAQQALGLSVRVAAYTVGGVGGPGSNPSRVIH